MRDRKAAGWVGASLMLVAVSGCDTTGLIYGPPCHGHGAQTAEGCDCEEGYIGDLCDGCAPGYQDNDGDTSCNLDCQSAGLTCDPPLQCVDLGGIAECDCEPGYAGDDCTACAANYQDNDHNGSCEASCSHPDYDCAEHGECSDTSGTAICVCDTGYGGTDCESCASQYQDNDHDGSCTISCSHPSADCNHGDCDDSTGAITCDCDALYTGVDCRQCVSGYQDNDNDGECLPTCQTAGYTCSGHGTCDDSSGVASCDCADGYADDGDGNCVSASFIVTLVDDGLDPTDGQLMRDGLLGLGYAQQTYNSNVSSSQLIGYLQSYVTMVYHTGHGDVGEVLTSNGSISTNSTIINATNTIFATCLTLSDTNWKNQFGPTAQNVMGYTNYSFDGPDDDVVNDYIDELAGGRTHLQAWYLSNASQSSLDDRWAVYARIGGDIIEYSARTGNHPAMAMVGDWQTPADNLRVAAALAADQTDYSASFASYAITGGDVPWSTVEPGDLPAWLQPTTMTEAEAIGLATGYLVAHWLMPADAVVGEVTAIDSAAGGGSSPSTLAGYSVRFERQLDGLTVRGNGTADHLTVLIADGKVVAFAQYWPMLAPQSRGAAPLLSIAEALAIAAPEIASSLKTGLVVDLVAATPVYGTTGPGQAHELRPAYEIASSDGLSFVVDAETGQLLR